MSCGMGMIKYLLFIFNFIFAICGLALLVVGVLLHLQVKEIKDTLEENVTFPSITLIVIGSIIFVIAFFGCCGAIRESHCMTITFASLLLTILIVQVAVAIYAFVVLSKSGIDVKGAYSKVFHEYYENKAQQETVDAVQSGLFCCGVDSFADYYQLNGNNTIPWSCCGLPEDKVCRPGVDKIYQTGCVKSIKEVIKLAGKTLGGIALGVAGVELIGIIFALCLANSIRNGERRGFRV